MLAGQDGSSQPHSTTDRTFASGLSFFADVLDQQMKNRYNLSLTMKKDLHPTDYRPVVFQDDSADFAFLTQSTASTNETIKWEDGKEYPLVKVHISSASHPFFTGEEKIIDTEGRVDRFKARFAAAEARKEALANKAKKAVKLAEKKATKSDK
jgi:large subunit ribosomal protein L31